MLGTILRSFWPHLRRRKALAAGQTCLFLVAVQSGLAFAKPQDPLGDASTRPKPIQSPMTIAERSNYLATSKEVDVNEFLEQIDRMSPLAQRIQIGRTHEGRALWALVLAKEPNVRLPLAAEDPRLVIAAIGGIHSGECDGKEAMLALAREVAKGAKPEWLEQAVLVLIPNFNADGNERVGPMHRPGQEGPALGMGTRENAFGQDLNRDFVKLDTMEVRSLVRMLDAWNADVLIDAHTTNGSLHRYDMTYSFPHSPAADPETIAWLKRELLPTVSKRMTDRGAPIFPYGNFNRDHTVWESYGFEPRYSTEYMGLRGKIGILVESYSYATYQRRIEVSYAFMEECIDGLARRSKEVAKLVRRQVTEPPRGVSIQGKIESQGERAQVAGYKWSSATDQSFPSPKDRRRISEMEPTEYPVEIADAGVGTKQIDAPEYYYIPEEYSWVASRVRLHGVPMIQVSGSANAGVVRYRIQSRKDLPEYQFRKMYKFEIDSEKVECELGPGWLVPTRNALGKFATYVLEPHSDESFAMWGFFEPQLKAGDVYPIYRCDSMPSFPHQTTLSPLEWMELKASDIRGERLSLPKLFAPENKVSYSAPPAPLPKWMPHGEGYIVRRENRWMHIDAASGAMHPWETPVRMAEALGKLPEFPDNAAAPFSRQIGLFDDSLETALIPFKNDLFFYDLRTDQAVRLTESPELEEELFELSPTKHHVAFVRGQNLMVVDCKTREIKSLTSDGGGEILNGKLDWVYQEEVYGRGKFKAYWWNPDGTKIAFLRLDETPVPNFVIDDSISFAQRIENMRYPKAGQGNPRVELNIVDIGSGAIQQVPLNLPEEDRLVVRVGWKPGTGNQLVYQIQNRIQNRLDLVLFDLESGSSQTLVEESSPAWVDVIDVPRWLLDGSFLWVSDSNGGRRHLYHVAMDGKKRALTSGEWDVKEIVAISDSGKNVWLTAHRSAPVNTDLLRLSLETGEIEDVSGGVGSHRVSVHPTGSYYLDASSDLGSPSETWLKDRLGKRVRLASDYVSDRFEYVQTGQPELIQIPARDGQKLEGLLYRPAREQEPGSRTPVVIYVYGGPSAPTVENSWTHRSDLWHRHLTDLGIAVLLCDNRSALGKGNADTWKIYKNLGELELRDLEDTVGWLSKQSWTDTDRVGIWGWSYGGYFTAYAMTHSKLFRAGISGAPVTDWRNYDSIYTERYMDTPEVNSEGYKSSSVVEAAGNLHGKLLLIHGEIDDNVHMANTLQLVHALQKKGKQFELMIYPKNRHGITDPQQVYHQFEMMTDFWMRNLK